jgi:hypothetical protein
MPGSGRWAITKDLRNSNPEHLGSFAPTIMPALPLSGRCLEPVAGSRRFGKAVSFVPMASLAQPFERSEPRSRAIATSMTQVLMDRFQTFSVPRLRGISKYGSRDLASDQCRHASRGLRGALSQHQGHRVFRTPCRDRLRELTFTTLEEISAQKTRGVRGISAA